MLYRTLARNLFAAACLAAGSASAAVFTVGSLVDDLACDFDSIQAALNAAAANGPGEDTIYVTNTGTYTNLALFIGDQSVVIAGGYDTCFFGLPAAAADLSGDSFDPVISIAPSSASTLVTLRNLNIHGGGQFGTSAGGGIYVTNSVLLTIESSTIELNNAASGGGIYVDASAGYPAVVLNPGTSVGYNYAQNLGGGIFLGGGNLYLVADQVHIDHNYVAGAGGGIAVTNGTVSVGNPDLLPARFDATGASVSTNTAGTYGGGIYAAGSGADVFANELIVDGNMAGSAGGGIMASDNAYVSMVRDYPSAFVLQCPNALGCSRLSNNTVGAAALGTVGGALALYSGAIAEIAQTIISGNTAQDGSAAYLDAQANMTLEGVLITGNQSYDSPTYGAAPIRTSFLGQGNQPTVDIAFTTFAGNYEQPTTGPNHLAEDIIAQQNTHLAIYSTAAYDSPYFVIAYSSYILDCVVRPYGSGDDPQASNTRVLRTNTPGFNNAAAGDYRLRSESALNDYCDTSAYTPSHRDLVLTPRCHDDPRKANVYGACDVGAYESDHIFGNGCE